MDQKYNNLYQMIQQNSRADAYFNSLPDYVQNQIKTHAGGVNSLESLRDYAENLLRGDD